MSEVTEAPEAAPDAPRTFADMNLDPAVKQALDEMGYEVPMEVQHTIYDRAMAGTDLMVQSRTGSGKTAAFGIPLAQLVPAGAVGLQALILAPTRELAIQVSQELQRICMYRNIQVVPIYGGAPMGKQIAALKAGAQIAVGTPGRVLDHIRRRTMLPATLRLLVLDECDEMLSMGFQEEIEAILKELPTQRQTLLLSATIPEEIERIGRRYMREPEKVILSADFVGVHEIDHYYYLVSGVGRARDLLSIFEVERPDSAIVFCNTRDDTGLVAEVLQKHGHDAEAISSDLTQPDRERVMGKMRSGQLKFLVATDIAARGIDISNLPFVVNYTFPESPEVYIHRTGRTGRAGKSGVAVSLIGPREIGSFYYLKLLYKIKPVERELPTEAELKARREGARFDELRQRVTGEPTEEWVALARRVWQSVEGERLMAALIQQFFGEKPAEPAPRERSRPEAHRAPRPRREGRPERREPREAREPRERRERPAEPREGREPRPQADADAGGPREFWETWIDEKAVRSDPPDKDKDRERGAAREERPRRAEEPREEAGFVRLYVNVGKREGLDAEDVKKLALDAAPDAADALGRVVVLGSHSYLSVKEEVAAALAAAMTGRKVGEREILVEKARR
ncbi:MAG TPA: DEAD/DEAH box helicase [Haliangiales bacterium]|nr:DEAD/DEAH box helicase [Haliangiales bacterium]